MKQGTYSLFSTPLPTELTLLILSHHTLSTLAALHRVNRAWGEFLSDNESGVYRAAAVIEGYVGDGFHGGMVLGDLGPLSWPDGRTERKEQTIYSEKAMRDVDGWKSFCKKRKTIARSWAGRAPSRILSSPRCLDVNSVALPLATQQHLRAQVQTHAQGSAAEAGLHYRRVHRIKVDEIAGISMATTHLGGLVVRDLETDEVLWELPAWYVRPFAHLEYGEGYMIFDRNDGNKEVWRRAASTHIFTPSSPEDQFISTSAPDERQRHVMAYISVQSTPSESESPLHTSTSTSTQPTSSTQPTVPASKAAFTPHAVLHMPEATRAYRFVYPDLLVVSLERAYVWDVRTGRLVQHVDRLQQRVDEIQVVQPPSAGGEPEDGGEDGHESEEEKEGEEEDMDADSSDDDNMGMGTGNPQQTANYPPIPNPNANSNSSALPQFLGLVRYVDISSRHIFFVGRFLLRVFSRETGKFVLDMPSVRRRYGRWRWEVASARWAERNGVERDDYSRAKAKGKGREREGDGSGGGDGPREAVRVPVSFTEEDYEGSLDERMVVDQFLAVHVSNDGKHIAALLSGSRLVVIPHFETFVNLRSAEHERVAGVGSASTSTSRRQTKTKAKTKAKTQTKANIQEQIQQAKTKARDAQIFAHTLDIQLGAPTASSSVYLAYENGRVGVVTTNAVYVVIPNIPADPPPATAAAPTIQITRLPYFSNPSWLSEVSCLMMSDTGLYLNWNSTWPSRDNGGTRVVSAMEAQEDGVGEEAGEGEGPDMRGELEELEREKAVMLELERETMLEEWEREYENDLEAYEQDEWARYRYFQNGDLVEASPRDLEESEMSTIYCVDFASPPPEPAHVRAQVLELVMDQMEMDEGASESGSGGGVHEVMEVVDEAEPEDERDTEVKQDILAGEEEGEENLILLLV